MKKDCPADRAPPRRCQGSEIPHQDQSPFRQSLLRRSGFATYRTPQITRWWLSGVPHPPIFSGDPGTAHHYEENKTSCKSFLEPGSLCKEGKTTASVSRRSSC